MNGGIPPEVRLARKPTRDLPQNSALKPKIKPPLAERVRRLCAALARAYPDAHCELAYRTPLELLVATILSAQCADTQVNRVTPALFAQYPNAVAYAQAELAELEHALRAIGLFRSKAKNLRACGQLLVERHGGQVPFRMAELIELPGVGRKTANVVLGNAFGQNIGVVVDTHVARLSVRLGLTRATDPVKIERVLMRLVPRVDWTLFSHWLIFHGRRRCKAQNPDCPACELREHCPSYPRFMRLRAKKATGEARARTGEMTSGVGADKLKGS